MGPWVFAILVHLHLGSGHNLRVGEGDLAQLGEDKDLSARKLREGAKFQRTALEGGRIEGGGRNLSAKFECARFEGGPNLSACDF